jgi:AcrR family transcriptional regulator
MQCSLALAAGNSENEYAWAMATFRDGKRERTRAALVDAATRLFLQDGYEETRIADIAASADVGLRTFFTYFATKDEILFPDATTRIAAAIESIDSRRPEDQPQDVLLKALDSYGVTSTDLVDERAALRLSLMRKVPAVAGRGQQIQAEALTSIAQRLHAAFPEELNEFESAAMVGAFIGAISATLQVMFDSPDWAGSDQATRRERLLSATEAALRPWRQAPRPVA